MPSYSYWRLNVINSTYNVLSIAEIKFYDSLGAQIATTGGTASADNASFGAASNAFDGTASTFWATASPATPASPHWIQYRFPSAVTPATYSIAIRNDGLTQCPDSWALQGSNDGSSWTTIGNYSASWTSSGQVKTFTVGSFGLGTAYRLLITAAQGGSVVALAEIAFKDADGSAISLANGASSGSSIYTGESEDGSANAFDGNTSANCPFWASNAAPSGGSPQWIAYRFSDSQTVGSFVITSRNDVFWGQAPAAFSLQSSPDGSTWTTVQSYTATWTTQGQSQTFTVSLPISVVFRRTRSMLGTRAGSRQTTQPMALLKQSTTYTRDFLMVSSTDHITGATGKTITVNLSKAGGSFSAAGGTITEVANGWYKIALTTSDTSTLGDLAFNCTATGCDNTDFADQVVAVDMADAVRLGLAALPNANAAANGGLPTVDSTNSVKVQIPFKRNTAVSNFPFTMIDSSGNPKIGLTITSQRSIDGGSFAITANTATEVGNGDYVINLAAADTNGTNSLVLRFSATGALDNLVTILLQP